MDSLREKLLKEEWEREWEAWRHKEAMKKKDKQLQLLHQQVLDITNDKTKIRELALNQLGCRWPFPSYLVFLWECYYLFYLKSVFEKRPYLSSSTRNFLEIFRTCDFDEQSLLCELFLHNIMCEYVSTKMVAIVFSYMGDLQLWAFLSFMRNQIKWHLAMKLAETNEERVDLWVREEPRMIYELRHEFKLFLIAPRVKE